MPKGQKPYHVPNRSQLQKTAEKLATSPYKYDTLIFPSNLGSREWGMGHYILFNINTRVDAPRLNTSKSKQTIENTFQDSYLKKTNTTKLVTQDSDTFNRGDILPVRDQAKRVSTSILLSMPTTAITATHTANWDIVDTGMFQGAVQAYRTISSQYKGSKASEFTGKLSDAISEEQKKSLLLTMANVLPEEATQLIFAGQGKAANPRSEVLFKSLGFRSFSFSFTLTPRSKDEVETIQKIIKVFKYAQAPELNTDDKLGSFFTYPDEFDISFYVVDSHGKCVKNPYLHKMAPSALTNVSIDYTSGGTFSSFQDGEPTQYTLELTFTELEQITKERVKEGY